MKRLGIMCLVNVTGKPGISISHMFVERTVCPLAKVTAFIFHWCAIHDKDLRGTRVGDCFFQGPR